MRFPLRFGKVMPHYYTMSHNGGALSSTNNQSQECSDLENNKILDLSEDDELIVNLKVK